MLLLAALIVAIALVATLNGIPAFTLVWLVVVFGFLYAASSARTYYMPS